MTGLGNYTFQTPPTYPVQLHAQPIGDVASVVESQAIQLTIAVVVGVAGWKIFGHFFPDDRDFINAHVRQMFRAKTVTTNARARRLVGRRRRRS